MNKRGQFYLIAAVIILVAVASIMSVKTYTSSSPKPRTIESMSSELKEESFRIVDYGIYNDINLTSLLNNFTENYSYYFLQKTNNANIIFVYGNSSDLWAVKYDNATTGKVTADIGMGAVSWNMEGTFINRTKINVANLPPPSNKVAVTIFNNTYNFNIKENEMFYFVIVQSKEGEVNVEKT